MNDFKVSIFRRAGRLNYEMQYRCPRSGKKIRRTTGQAKKRDALKAAGKWEKELRENTYKPLERTTWEEFRERYEEEALADNAVAENTAEKIAGIFNTVERLLTPRLLTDVDGDALSRYARELRRDEIEEVDGNKVLRQRARAESTIAGHLAHIRAAMAWAVKVKLLRELPEFPEVIRAKGGAKRKGRYSKMKGRPITAEEFDRIVAAVPKVLTTKPHKRNKNPDPPTAAQIASWRFLLNGLWLSGLRLGEALALHWSDESTISVQLDGRRPMLWIPAHCQKNNEDTVAPIAPEFAEFLLKTPEHLREGFVFDPQARRGQARPALNHVSKLICDMGRAAGVKVNTDAAGKVKFASAHDLRRSFGERWAPRVMPTVLKELMRHSDIETTMAYYVSRNAENMADVLWAAYQGQGGPTKPGLGASMGATADFASDTESDNELSDNNLV